MIEAREELIDSLAVRQYAEHNRAFTPLYPWVFVRVLPKEQTTRSGLILPSTDQNKTIHEGIVLGTWKPRYVKGNQILSSFAPGDHVLFPHWSGLPIEGFSAKHYRVVRELDWKENEQGGIFARVEYAEESTRPGQMIKDLILDWEGSPLDLARAIEQRFLLVDREAQSVTLSGR